MVRKRSNLIKYNKNYSKFKKFRNNTKSISKSKYSFDWNLWKDNPFNPSKNSIKINFE